MNELRISPMLRRALLHPRAPIIFQQCQFRGIANTSRPRQQQVQAPKPKPHPDTKAKQQNSKPASPPTPSKPPQKTSPPSSTPPEPASEDDPDPRGPKVLYQLSRPIGLAEPPLEGDNSGLDLRTAKERRDDLVNYDKHIARRREMFDKFAKPWYRHWKHLRHHDGKTFLAPPRLLKAQHAFYFPNLVGKTLAGGEWVSTTPALRGKISIVTLFTRNWSENQVNTFVGRKRNPELGRLLEEKMSLLQKVEINGEQKVEYSWLTRVFSGRLRREREKEQWSRYFRIGKGWTDELCQAILWNNPEVGFVYLVDQECRIRWAGCGDATDDERGYLVAAVKKLVDQYPKPEGS